MSFESGWPPRSHDQPPARDCARDHVPEQGRRRRLPRAPEREDRPDLGVDERSRLDGAEAVEQRVRAVAQRQPGEGHAARLSVSLLPASSCCRRYVSARARASALPLEATRPNVAHDVRDASDALTVLRETSVRLLRGGEKCSRAGERPHRRRGEGSRGDGQRNGDGCEHPGDHAHTTSVRERRS